MPDNFSAVVPPDTIPNSEVKRRSTEGSMVINCARAGRYLAP